MPRPRHLGAALLLLASLGLACVRAEKLDERIARAWCDHAVECGDFKNIRTCMDTTFTDPGDTYLSAAIDAGRIDYDSAKASRCVRAIRALKCHRGEDLAAVEATCEGIFTGAVPPEEPCMIAAECEGQNSVCGRPPGCTGQCCPGQCRYRPGPFAVGEPCQRANECERDAFCRFDINTAESRCTAIPKAGQSCASVGICDRDAFCDGEICRPRGSQSASCQSSAHCQPDAYCSPSGRCQKRSDEGERCDPEVGHEGCLRGDTYCVDQRCQKRAKPGELCTSGAGDCVSYAFCEDTVCVEYAMLGDPCDGIDPPCHPDLFCVSNACIRQPTGTPAVCPIP